MTQGTAPQCGRCGWPCTHDPPTGHALSDTQPGCLPALLHAWAPSSPVRCVTQVSRAQAANEALRAQLQQLQQDKQEAARQLSAVQHQLSLVQESNRHLQAQLIQNRGAVAALTKQLQAASLQEQGDGQQLGQNQWQWPQALQHMTG